MQNLEKKEDGVVTKPQIQFISGFEEMTVPRRVRLTKSENGETGTATFLFFEPTVFSTFLNLSFEDPILIKSMNLIWDKKQITTKDVKIYFKNGKPIVLRSILIFRNSTDWFNFLNFMSCYSKETGLSFTEFK
jgi:photosystem II reaction center protein Psb28